MTGIAHTGKTHAPATQQTETYKQIHKDTITQSIPMNY